MIKLVLETPIYYGKTSDNKYILLTENTMNMNFKTIRCKMRSIIRDTETHEILERNCFVGESFRNDVDPVNNKLGKDLALSRVKIMHYQNALNFGNQFPDSLKFITFISYIVTYFNKEKNHSRYLRGTKEIDYPTDIHSIIMSNVEARLQPLKKDSKNSSSDDTIIIK